MNLRSVVKNLLRSLFLLPGVLAGGCADSEDDPMTLANWHVRCGEFQQAIQIADEAIEKTPDNPNWFVTRGRAYFGAGDFEAAMSDYNEALRINPKHSDAFYQRSALFKELGDLVRAESDNVNAHRYDVDFIMAVGSSYDLTPIASGPNAEEIKAALAEKTEASDKMSHLDDIAEGNAAKDLDATGNDPRNVDAEPDEKDPLALTELEFVLREGKQNVANPSVKDVLDMNPLDTVVAKFRRKSNLTVDLDPERLFDTNALIQQTFVNPIKTIDIDSYAENFLKREMPEGAFVANPLSLLGQTVELPTKDNLLGGDRFSGLGNIKGGGRLSGISFPDADVDQGLGWLPHPDQRDLPREFQTRIGAGEDFRDEPPIFPLNQPRPQQPVRKAQPDRERPMFRQEFKTRSLAKSPTDQENVARIPQEFSGVAPRRANWGLTALPGLGGGDSELNFLPNLQPKQPTFSPPMVRPQFRGIPEPLPSLISTRPRWLGRSSGQQSSGLQSSGQQSFKRDSNDPLKNAGRGYSIYGSDQPQRDEQHAAGDIFGQNKNNRNRNIGNRNIGNRNSGSRASGSLKLGNRTEIRRQATATRGRSNDSNRRSSVRLP